MDTVLDILQAAGIGAAVGIRPFLPALLVGALAAGDLGVDFDGTGWSFLEDPIFLAVMLAGVVAATLLRRQEAVERHLLQVVSGGVAALLGAGSLADHGGPVAAGIAAGVAAAVLALVAMQPVFTRVRARLDAGAAGLLPLYREALALAAAGLSVLFPPLALVVIAGLVFLLAGGRRREGEKYAGLRILR
jgi:hypothetical protein